MLGIDVSKAHLTCTLLDPRTEKVRWSREFPNTDAGIAQLLRLTDPEVPWVLEPTGRYGNRAVDQAYAAGRRVLLAQPKRAKLFLASEWGRMKTDPIDSHGLSLYGACRPLAPYPRKGPAVEQLDQLLAARRSLSLSMSRLHLQARELEHAAPGLHT